MKTEHHQSDSNRRQQRKQSSLFSPFTSVRFLLLIVLSFACADAAAQCYIDPFTGQRICTRPYGNCSPTGPSRQVAADSPTTNNVTANVDSSAHCRISVNNGTLGSGTLVARDPSIGLVLTCAHLFDDSTARIIVSFPRGGRFAAKLVDLDHAQDLAVLAIRRPELEPLTLADAEPAGPLTACGFGPDGAFRCVQGAITGHATAAGATYPSTTIAGAVRPGDSGGAVLNASGQLVGVVWGQRAGQTYATCGRPMQAFLNRVLKRELRRNGQEPDNGSGSRLTELESRIRALDAKKQDKGDYLQHGDLNGYLRATDAAKLTKPLALKTEVETKLHELSSRYESVHSVVDSVKQHVAQIAAAREGILQGISIGKLAVSTLGLSGPLAIAVVIASGLVGRRVKKRLSVDRKVESVTAAPNSTTMPRTVAIDSPPPPQRAVPETHYVPVEKDSFAKAHQWASEHVARKYPGATEVLQAQDSLIKQFLAAK